ncbi:MAG TPA: class I SAM-dependent methyltransferase [Pyrinomonadaceae bacterium]|nr:class I SAM-dependent methyltransferase [Pyrinomonadaceae bacterium]
MRFKKVEGIDYKRGAEEYPRKLAPSDRHHLLTKPFYNLAFKHDRWAGDGPDSDTHRHFCDFANLAVALALPPGSRILDVGCGSGWLCEYFARFGYDVTGIDISSDLIDMARQRLANAPFGLDHETGLSSRFLVHDIEQSAMTETFDAVVCYDALHHFEDEHAVLKNIYAMLENGGQLFVLEGERPPAGSDTEDELRSVMREYETLESPFTREYLLSLLCEHGFAVVGDYVSVNGLFERDSNSLLSQINAEPFNYLLCKKISPAPSRIRDSRKPGRLLARFTASQVGSLQLQPGERITLSLEIENAGDTVWLVSRAAPRGTVRLGVKILNEKGEPVIEVHGSPPLSRAVVPGEKVVVQINQPVPDEAGNYSLKIDLVCQDICWFEQHGSEPLRIEFQVKD